MKRLFAAVLLVASTGVMYAHNGLEHVMGTVTRASGTSLEVRTTTGKLTTVTVNGDTKWVKGTSPAGSGDVHPGDRVVIHARPIDGKLQAVEVALGNVHAK